MLRNSSLLLAVLLPAGCSREAPAPVGKTPLNVVARVRVLRPADRAAGATLAVCFETTYPLEPKPFPLDCSDFAPDFRPELRLTYFADRRRLGTTRPVAFRPDC